MYDDTFGDAVRKIGDTENEQRFNYCGRKGSALRPKALFREENS